MTDQQRQVGLGRLADRLFEAVIFDLDGTLIDSTPAVLRSWATWTREHGLTPEDHAGHHGMPSVSVVRALLPADRHDAAIARINELEVADVSDIVVLPGAIDALQALRYAKNAIATSCDLRLAKARIAASKLAPPSVLVTADDVVRGKPAPDPFLEAAHRLQVDPANCLVVEDSPIGLQAARAAGCATLAVITTTPADELLADAVVHTLADVRFELTPQGIRVREV
jgi:sugar-phosphatase